MFGIYPPNHHRAFVALRRPHLLAGRWLADFNTYGDIGSRVYVVTYPDPITRLPYAAGLGTACGLFANAAVWAVGRQPWLRFMTLIILFTGMFYVLADLNWYVYRFGPNSED